MKVKLTLLCSITLCFVILFRMSFNTFFAKVSKTISYHTAKSVTAKKPGCGDLKRRNLKVTDKFNATNISFLVKQGKATLVKKIKLPAFIFPVREHFFIDASYEVKPLCSINGAAPLQESEKYILISILRI
jgi:hypothetical protein